jgi:hypothetical protein
MTRVEINQGEVMTVSSSTNPQSDSTKPKASHRAGWMIIFILAILMVLNSLFFGLIGVTPEIFEVDTGVTWSAFSTDYPSVARHLDLAERLNGSGYAGTALFAAALAWFGLRRGHRWAWYALWIFPGVLCLGALWFFTHDQAGIGAFYVGVAMVAILGLVLSYRSVQEQ